MRLAILFMLVGGQAHAEPPAPLQLPDLGAHSELVVSPGIASAQTEGVLTSLEVRGRVALGGGLELFGELPASAYVGIFGPGLGALGNLRAGARIAIPIGELAIAPSIWAWLPTGSAPSQSVGDLPAPFERALQSGLADGRAYIPVGALGTAIDLAWRRPCAFAQLELGMSLIDDRGRTEIDDVFAAVGVGAVVQPRLALLAEWRLDVNALAGRYQSIGVGVARGDGEAFSWRVRAYPIVGSKIDGADVVVDLVWRFE